MTRDGENIILNMPGNLTFATDSTNVKSSFSPVLDAVAEVLKEYKSTMIQVAGHTDSTVATATTLLSSSEPRPWPILWRASVSSRCAWILSALAKPSRSPATAPPAAVNRTAA